MCMASPNCLFQLSQSQCQAGGHCIVLHAAQCPFRSLISKTSPPYAHPVEICHGRPRRFHLQVVWQYPQCVGWEQTAFNDALSSMLIGIPALGQHTFHCGNEQWRKSSDRKALQALYDRAIEVALKG